MQDRKCLCAACPAVVLRLKIIQVSDVREVDINLLLGLLIVAFCALVDNDFVNEGVQCILFGDLPNAGQHAVVVYGYNEYENSGYYT